MPRCLCKCRPSPRPSPEHLFFQEHWICSRTECRRMHACGPMLWQVFTEPSAWQIRRCRVRMICWNSKCANSLTLPTLIHALQDIFEFNTKSCSILATSVLFNSNEAASQLMCWVLCASSVAEVLRSCSVAFYYIVWLALLCDFKKNIHVVYG